MEDFSFDISGILSAEEADKLFEEQEANPGLKEMPDNEPDNNEPAEVEETPEPETVGEEENETQEDTVSNDGDGSSPNVYSSIASALKNDGIFPDFDDEEINAANTPEAFAELFKKAVQSGVDATYRRVDNALSNGVSPDTIRMYEQTLQYLGSINPEALASEGEDGENLRKQLIYNDLLHRGYDDEKAKKEIEKSFKAGSDIDDAKDALASLSTFYRNGYEKAQNDAKNRAEEARRLQQKQSDDFRKLVLEDEVKIGETKLDKRTCQKVYDAVASASYKDPDTGRYLTEVQRFQKEHPLEFLKQLGMWFVLTDGGKSVDNIVKGQVRAEKNKGIKELANKINSSSLNRDGSLRYRSTSNNESDPLLSDGWKVGW